MLHAVMLKIFLDYQAKIEGLIARQEWVVARWVQRDFLGMLETPGHIQR